MITSISELIANVESGNNPHALRFEPTHEPRAEFVALCQKYQKFDCSVGTATALCKMSFGAYQIMGDSLYWLGYTGSVIDFIDSPDEQTAMFGIYCKARGIDYSLDDVINNPTLRANFARTYNGDAVAYGAAMMRAYNESVTG